ncbi:Lariat debranching enzyme -like protein [Gossypium arboreum]|uniref:Lariat debranching enzyme-like protein n=1 Tax=Gossypium arboreum TaxID=29729 RepID=A0A0B0NAP5_GOSAR|nr:Lariat debranching enzyme -like protein [Gossypium arboreum]
MKIAVEGCMHGDLDKVYDTIKYIENIRNIKIYLLLCYGDFQAVRNGKDMDSLNVAPNYREMKSFWKFCSGQEVAPVPTIFIGGNNEASNYLWELYYGGWAAPNIYFLGYAVPPRGRGQARGGDGNGRGHGAVGENAGHAEARQPSLVYAARHQEDEEAPEANTRFKEFEVSRYVGEVLGSCFVVEKF